MMPAVRSGQQFLVKRLMILYDAAIPATLMEFGIQIPIHDSRTTRTFEALKSDPQLGPSILSIHMAEGWPLDGPSVLPDGRPNPSFIPSDIDIPVAAGEEALYLERLERGLGQLDQLPPADLAIVECGADPYEEDQLPSASLLKLSLPQLLKRDQMVYRFLKDRGIPNACLIR